MSRRPHTAERRALRRDIVQGAVLLTLGVAIVVSLCAIRFRTDGQEPPSFDLVIRAPIGGELHTFIADYGLTGADCLRTRARIAGHPQYASVTCEARR